MSVWFCLKNSFIIKFVCYLLFSWISHWKFEIFQHLTWYEICSFKKLAFLRLIWSKWVKIIKKLDIICKKQQFVAIFKITIPLALAANRLFLCWLKWHLTISLIAPKQYWCHFEALECIFHFDKENFLSSHQLTRYQQSSAFPNLWSTL